MIVHLEAEICLEEVDGILVQSSVSEK